MTVIAWDGETLAADREAGNSWLRYGTTTKIRRMPDGSLIGTAGSAAVTRELIVWFQDGAHPDKFPASNRDQSDCSRLLHITTKREIYVYENGPYPIRFEDRVIAIGAGQEVATAGMLWGKTARESVEMACRICKGCGNGIDTLTFE